MVTRKAIFFFSYISSGGTISNENVQEWNGYRFEILDDFKKPLKMRVTKLNDEDSTTDLKEKSFSLDEDIFR